MTEFFRSCLGWGRIWINFDFEGRRALMDIIKLTERQGVFRYGINLDILHLKAIFIYFTYIFFNYFIFNQFIQ